MNLTLHFFDVQVKLKETINHKSQTISKWERNNITFDLKIIYPSYTNADLKISLYVRIHLKIIP